MNITTELIPYTILIDPINFVQKLEFMKLTDADIQSTLLYKDDWMVSRKNRTCKKVFKFIISNQTFFNSIELNHKNMTNLNINKNVRRGT